MSTRHLVLAFLCSAAVLAYVQRLGINSAAETIEAEFGIGTEKFALLGTAWLLGYAALQVPAGWLADAIGGRKALAGFAILWSVVTACVGLAQSFESLLGLWFLMGVAMAGVFPSAAKSVGAWLPDAEKGTAAGLIASCTLLGAMVAAFLTVRLLFDLGWSWRFIYAVYGVAGVAWAVTYLAATPERSVGRVASPAMSRTDWSRLFRSAPLWFLCGQQFFRAGAMIFFLNWFQKYLKEARGFEPVDAAYAATGVFLASLVGSALGGVCSDGLLRVTGNRRLSRQGIALVGMIVAGALCAVSLQIADPGVVVMIFAAGAFIASFGGTAGYTVAIEFGGRRIGLVFSLMNMCGNLGAALVNQVVGSLRERTGSWDVALVAVAVIFLIDAVCWALLNPKEPLFENPDAPR